MFLEEILLASSAEKHTLEEMKLEHNFFIFCVATLWLLLFTKIGCASVVDAPNIGNTVALPQKVALVFTDDDRNNFLATEKSSATSSQLLLLDYLNSKVFRYNIDGQSPPVNAAINQSLVGKGPTWVEILYHRVAIPQAQRTEEDDIIMIDHSLPPLGAFLTCYLGNKIQYLDFSTNNITTVIEGLARPYGMTVPHIVPPGFPPVNSTVVGQSLYFFVTQTDYNCISIVRSAQSVFSSQLNFTNSTPLTLLPAIGKCSNVTQSDLDSSAALATLVSPRCVMINGVQATQSKNNILWHLSVIYITQDNGRLKRAFPVQPDGSTDGASVVSLVPPGETQAWLPSPMGMIVLRADDEQYVVTGGTGIISLLVVALGDTSLYVIEDDTEVFKSVITSSAISATRITQFDSFIPINALHLPNGTLVMTKSEMRNTVSLYCCTLKFVLRRYERQLRLPKWNVVQLPTRSKSETLEIEEFDSYMATESLFIAPAPGRCTVNFSAANASPWLTASAFDQRGAGIFFLMIAVVLM